MKMKQLAQVMPDGERPGFRSLKLATLPPESSAAKEVFGEMRPFLRTMNLRQREIALCIFSIVFVGETAATPAVLRKGREAGEEIRKEMESSGRTATAAFLIAETAKDVYRDETYTSNSVNLERELLLIDADIAESCRNALKTLFGRNGRSLGGLDVIEVLPQGIDDEKLFAEIADIAKKWQYFRGMEITDGEFFETLKFLRGLGP